MARPRVADGEDGLQLWKFAANVLNNQSRTAHKGWPCSLRVRVGLTSAVCGVLVNEQTRRAGD
jgi:hypothetical protein